MTELPAIPRIESPGALRLSLRETAHPRTTYGAAPGYLQCNLLILPHGLAHDFSTFCAANAQACPLIYQTSPGQWDMPELGDDIDLRTDLGSYRVFRDGQAVTDLLHLDGTWQGDFVTFVLGSSYGLDAVLAAAGIATPYLTRGETPAHYITGVDSRVSGTFRGPSAVTMRSLEAADAARVEALCEAYPHLHGAPLSIGDADALGIESLQAPIADIGRSATVQEGEVPVFWASALTAQLALSAARLPFCIANTPGHLLVTDIETEALRRDADTDVVAGDDAVPDSRPLEITTSAAIVADKASTSEHGYASAIRPARLAKRDGAGGTLLEAGKAARRNEQARSEIGSGKELPPSAEASDRDDEADDEALLLIDAEEEAAIAADATGDSSAVSHDDGEDARDDDSGENADIPLFEDDFMPDPDAEWPAAAAEDNSETAADKHPHSGALDPEERSSEFEPVDQEPLDLDVPHDDQTTASDLPVPLPMEWRQPPLSAGKLIRQRLAAASGQANPGKRDSIFW